VCEERARPAAIDDTGDFWWLCLHVTLDQANWLAW